MLNFAQMKWMDIPHMNGGEGIVNAAPFTDEQVKILRGVLKKGCSVGLHKHTDDCEIVYVLKGTARCLLDGVEEIVGPGQCHYCPKGSSHMVENAGEEDLQVFNVVAR